MMLTIKYLMSTSNNSDRCLMEHRDRSVLRGVRLNTQYTIVVLRTGLRRQQDIFNTTFMCLVVKPLVFKPPITITSTTATRSRFSCTSTVLPVDLGRTIGAKRR